jgi:hypothetical protein
MASKTVDEVRKALEELSRKGCMIVQCGCRDTHKAFVTEGLKVLDDYAGVKAEYEKGAKLNDDPGYREYMRNGMRAGEHQINFIAAILRTAGRMK